MVGGGSHGGAGGAPTPARATCRRWPRSFTNCSAARFRRWPCAAPAGRRCATRRSRRSRRKATKCSSRALDPARSFPTAKEFYEALSQLDGLQVAPPRSPRRLRPPPPAPAAPARLRPQKAPRPPPRRAFVPPEPKKLPLALIGGVAAVLTAGAVAFVFLQKAGDDSGRHEDPPAATTAVQRRRPPITPNGDLPEMAERAARRPPRPAPTPAATPPPPPTRQELLHSRRSTRQGARRKRRLGRSRSPPGCEWPRNIPESPVGQESPRDDARPLRQRPSPISAAGVPRDAGDDHRGGATRRALGDDAARRQHPRARAGDGVQLVFRRRRQRLRAGDDAARPDAFERHRHRRRRTSSRPRSVSRRPRSRATRRQSGARRLLSARQGRAAKDESARARTVSRSGRPRATFGP